MSIQFSYYRNIHASHMILTPALEGEPWEKEMLWRNRPRELILPEYNSRNGQTQLWYDITGKQAVDMLAELSDISYERVDYKNHLRPRQQPTERPRPGSFHLHG